MNDVHVLNLITDLLADRLEFGGGYYKAATMLAEEYGLDILGSGASGVCVEHPSDRSKVIRINGSVNSDSWTSFILFTRENYAPCFPKVYVQRHVHNEMMITIMEKLVPWNDSAVGSHDVSSAINNSDADALRRLFPHAESVEALLNMYQEIGYANDIHGGNYMKRPSTGELVLIDPYHARGQPKKYKTGPDSRFKMGKRVTVEVRTIEQRREDDAILAALSSEVEAERQAKDRVLRGDAKLVDHPRPERVQGALLQEQRMRGIRPRVAADLARIEAVAFADLIKQPIVAAPDLKALDALDRMQQRWFKWPEPGQLRGHRADVLIADSIGRDMAKPVRDIDPRMGPVWLVTGLKRRPAGIPGKKLKKWEAAVPCQKEAAERARERAEVYRNVHKRAA